MKYLYTLLLLFCYTNYSYGTIGPITGPASICLGSTITLSDTTTGGTWSSSNSTVALAGYTSGVIFSVGVGIATITYTKNASIATTSITVNPYVAPIIGSSAVCVGSSITMTDAYSGGTWTARNGNATVSGGIVTGITSGPDTISYSLPVSCGTGVATHFVNVNPLPNAGTISASSPSLCVYGLDTVTATIPGGHWSTNSSSIATINSTTGIMTALAGGTVSVSYSITALSCTSKVATTITINPLPAVNTITGASSVCINNSTTLTDSTPSGVWSISNSNATISSSGIVTAFLPGIDTVIYSVTNACGITHKTKPITIYPLPNAGTITSNDSLVCVGATLTLSNATTGGTWSRTNVNASINTSGIVSGISGGIDTIKYTVTSHNGCGSAVTNKIVTINPLPSVSNITGYPAICVGPSYAYHNSTTGGVWSLSNNLATVSDTGLVKAISPGNDTLFYSVTNGCGTVTKHLIFIIHPAANAGIVSDTVSEICVGANITLHDSIAGGTWSRTNNNATITTKGQLTALSAGLDTFRYIVIGNYGCGRDTAEKVVLIRALPNPGKISGLPAICLSSLDTLHDTASNGVWACTNANATISPTGILTPNNPGLDTVTYTVSDALCGSSSATYHVYIKAQSECNAAVTTFENPAKSFAIYPNPANQYLSIELSNLENNSNVEIINLLGQKVVTQNLTGNSSVVDIARLNPGCYFVICYKNGIEIGAKRFIKQ